MSELPFSKRAKLWASKFPLRLNRAYYSRMGMCDFNPSGTDIFQEDWDNLLILDACRYDTFAEISNLPGTLEKRISRASTTDEFMRANISQKTFEDTVYVTAQPSIHVTEGVDPTFHDVIDLWEDRWDDELRTVPPEVVTEAAIEVNKEYPDKRLFIHYLQPHYPFIGETGRKYFNYPGYDTPLESDETSEKFWDTVGTRINDVPEDIVKRAYRENLEETLPHVEELITTIPGKSVVTADHGEMLNDWARPVPYRLYGHPAGLYTRELVEVPWHTYTNGDRPEINDGKSSELDEVDKEVVEDRLQDLGYA
ncbi:hypothetical protein [Halorubrum sp. DM2]|uniref:hypothetical protein n=1 Tax=Halorubrum sp. DM2 TaxID=2527867 RepID=UPI0024B7D720|nr:hypothetical protein [Halorubrum sp. DM2]